MNTAFLLMAQYNAAAVIPVDAVCRDFFSHLTPQQFMRKANAGEIDLPITRIEQSQKAAVGVHLLDLADWIDKRREAARKENDQMHGRR
ncbi:Pyocin activator protein PrtN [Sinorhizobium meliloti RU11/001]|nr:Pyocin activator protein PrtN [Sinorhizobium meliloti RU11/001]